MRTSSRDLIRSKNRRPRAILEIAREVLGPQYEAHAEPLAQISQDTPLITVVGGRLIARGQIGPELPANDTDFRNAVFKKFAEECEGDLPRGRGHKSQELLQLVAAVQPVLEQDDQFADRAAVFLSIRPDQVWQGFDDLENRGALARGRGACVGRARSLWRLPPRIGFSERTWCTNGFRRCRSLPGLWRHAPVEPTQELLAELDWRITQRGPESQLLERIWNSIYTRFHGQNASEREHFLRELAAIAVFQPERVQGLGRLAMEEPVEPVRLWGIRRVTQEHVLRELPALFGVTIFHEPTSRDAFDRLWTLARHSSGEVHDRARRALKDAIAYRKYKNVIYNDRILALVEEKATDVASYQGTFTPLTLMNQILEREVDDTTLRGRVASRSRHCL